MKSSHTHLLLMAATAMGAASGGGAAATSSPAKLAGDKGPQDTPASERFAEGASLATAKPGQMVDGRSSKGVSSGNLKAIEDAPTNTPAVIKPHDNPAVPYDEHHGKGGMYALVDGKRVPADEDGKPLPPDTTDKA